MTVYTITLEEQNLPRRGRIQKGEYREAMIAPCDIALAVLLLALIDIRQGKLDHLP